VKAVRSVVKADPLKYLPGLKHFEMLELPFIYEVIEAYAELWREGAQLPWDAIWPNVLKFGFDLVSSDKFWDETNKESRRGFVANRYWINGSLGRLVESGAQKDDRAMPVECHDAARELIVKILARESGEAFSPESEAVSVAINSPRGRCLEGLINLALRECRLSDESSGAHNETWNVYRQIFDSELGREEEYEFVTLFVNYLPNFLYLSKDWVLANLPQVFDRERYVRWSCAMQAYAYVSNVYDSIYSFLRDNGHFLAALDDEILRERAVEKVVQNICVAYLQGKEDLEDEESLIVLLVSRLRQREISEVVHFLGALRGASELEGHRERVIALWVAIDESLDRAPDSNTFSRAKLLRLIDYLPNLTQPFMGMVLKAVDSLDDVQDTYSYEVLKAIARFSKEMPAEATAIWLRTLEKATMSYPEEAIRDALGNLIRGGPEGRRMAKDVVGQYAKRGNLTPHDILRDVLAREENADIDL
jgi:hypothetical protein